VPLTKSYVKEGVVEQVPGYIVHLELNSLFQIISIYETKPYPGAPESLVRHIGIDLATKPNDFLFVYSLIMQFQLTSEYKPTGDQPEAIKSLVEGLRQKVPYQTLLGVTGSGKTFTIANVIAQINKPTLVLSHNKTLAAQLYSEFKSFFPHNAVEYFVSYYDYYQPEAYIPSTDTYIEKDLSINDEIENSAFRLPLLCCRVEMM